MSIAEFPQIPGVTEGLRSELAHVTTRRSLCAGTEVDVSDDPEDVLFFLLSGTLRIARYERSGQQVVSYQMRSGPDGALAGAFLLQGDNCLAAAIAETDLELLSLPMPEFDGLMLRSPEFRGLMFRACSELIRYLVIEVGGSVFSRPEAAEPDQQTGNDGTEDLRATHGPFRCRLH